MIVIIQLLWDTHLSVILIHQDWELNNSRIKQGLRRDQNSNKIHVQ